MDLCGSEQSIVEIGMWAGGCRERQRGEWREQPSLQHGLSARRRHDGGQRSQRRAAEDGEAAGGGGGDGRGCGEGGLEEELDEGQHGLLAAHLRWCWG